MPLLAMFDLDGTLVDTSALYFDGVPRIVRMHLGMDVQADAFTDLWGHDVRTWFARAAGPDGESAVGAMYADFEAYYVAHHRDCPVYEGVGDGLRRLKQSGARVGIVTTRPQWRAELVSEHAWSADVDFIVGGDRVERRKPYPDSLDFAIARYGGGCPMKTYVGDTRLDVAAARATREPVVPVAALWGARDRAGITAAGPQAAFESFGECADWLIAGAEACVA
jgi:phosphoglycolate phosphatase